MKLRLHNNSVRVRLSQADMATFIAAGAVGDIIEFAPGERFSYRIEALPSVGDIHAIYSRGLLRIRVPTLLAREWMFSDLVGIRSEGGQPSVSIEKDFRCLHREGHAEGDDAHGYPNPLESARGEQAITQSRIT
jgi:hypothetical protein